MRSATKSLWSKCCEWYEVCCIVILSKYAKLVMHTSSIHHEFSHWCSTMVMFPFTPVPSNICPMKDVDWIRHIHVCVLCLTHGGWSGSLTDWGVMLEWLLAICRGMLRLASPGWCPASISSHQLWRWGWWRWPACRAVKRDCYWLSILRLVNPNSEFAVLTIHDKPATNQAGVLSYSILIFDVISVENMILTPKKFTY